MTSLARRAEPSPLARNLAWLVRLRWFSVGSQAFTVLVAQYMLNMELSVARLYAIVGIAAASNLACASVS